MNGARELPLRLKFQQYEKQARDLVKAFKSVIIRRVQSIVQSVTES